MHLITLIIVFLITTNYSNFIRRIIVAIPNLFLIQSFIPVSRVNMAFNGVSWYLSSLSFCFILAIWLYSILRKFNGKNLIYLLIVIYLIQLFIVFCGKNNKMHHWLFYINPIFRTIDFFYGMILAKILLVKSKIDIKVCEVYSFMEIIVSIAFICIYLLGKFIPQPFKWGVYYTPIIIISMYIFYFEKGIISKLLGKKVMLYLASISFEFYMVHQIIISVIQREISNIYIIIISSLILSLVLSIIMNRLNNVLSNKLFNKNFASIE